jgi:3-methyladenine DNA glycosylase AlkD
MQYKDIIKKIKSLADPEAVAGMARFGIHSKNNYGVSITTLRKIAREIGKDPKLAKQLWRSGIHEAKMLASLIDIPGLVTEKQTEEWVKDFDSWDICDQVCGNLFRRTKYAYKKALEWTKRKEEYVKRAGFTLMAQLAVHDKKADDRTFIKLLPIIKRGSVDDRNYVKKAVNWALRQIGKRNRNLKLEAIKAAKEIQELNSRSARWIASDAIRELIHR